MHEVAVLCEGHTEREFCKSVIRPDMGVHGVSLWGTLVGKPGRKRGGIAAWDRYKSELLRLAKERESRSVAVLVDYYAMPSTKAKAWPGRLEAESVPVKDRGQFVEDALRADLASELGDRFVPCVQLHEFESLLFVDPGATARQLVINERHLDVDTLKRRLEAILQNCGGSVEQIDDSPTTAPSKRIGDIVPSYDKVAWGIAAVSEVGLGVLRTGCPWLDRWLTNFEGIGRS